MKYINKVSVLMFALLIAVVNSASAIRFEFKNETKKWLVLNLRFEGEDIRGFYAIVGPDQRQIFGWRNDKCLKSIRWAWHDENVRCQDSESKEECLGGLKFVGGGREEYAKFKAGKPLNMYASETVDSHLLSRVDYSMKDANVIDKRPASRIAEAKRIAHEKGSYSLNCLDEFYRIKEGEKKFSDPIFIIEN